MSNIKKIVDIIIKDSQKKYKNVINNEIEIYALIELLTEVLFLTNREVIPPIYMTKFYLELMNILPKFEKPNKIYNFLIYKINEYLEISIDYEEYILAENFKNFLLTAQKHIEINLLK